MPDTPVPPAAPTAPPKPPRPTPTQLLDDALTAARGDFKLAASMVGMTVGQLNRTIRKNEVLFLKWIRTEPGSKYEPEVQLPTDLDVVKRDVWATPPPTPSPAEKATMSLRDRIFAGMMTEEEAKLKAGLETMGLNEKEQELAMSLQAFHGSQFRSSMEIIGAGVTRMAIKYQTLLEGSMARLDYVRSQLGPEQKNREQWVIEERNLMRDCVAIGDQLKKIMEVAHRGAMMMALIRYRMGASAKRPLLGRPGFSPILDAAPVNGEGEPR